MTDKRSLAQKIAEIVFDMAEQDRCLSNPRLADRIHEALVAADNPNAGWHSLFVHKGRVVPDPAYERMITEVVKGRSALTLAQAAQAVFDTGLTAHDYAKMTASEYGEYIERRMRSAVPPEFIGTPTMKWRGPEFHMKPNKDTDA